MWDKRSPDELDDLVPGKHFFAEVDAGYVRRVEERRRASVRRPITGARRSTPA